MAKPTDQDESLKRLGGGRWQTRDERFTIEPQSGTWVVVDAEQTDELGLPLVRGPFGSLGAAKEAIAGARDAQPAASPLSERAAKLRDRPDASTSASRDAEGRHDRREGAGQARRAGPVAKAATGRQPAPEPDPLSLAGSRPSIRESVGDANRLIDQLTEAGAPDPEGIARRDIVGEVPASAAFAIARALAKLGKDAPPAKVAELLVAGRDDDLGVH